MADNSNMTVAERNKAKRDRWLAKPGNREKQIAAVKRYRQKPYAKEAHRLRQLRYASNHREQERRRSAEWRKMKPEKAAETHRKYYLKNSNQVKAAAKAYRLAHPEAYREYERQYAHAKRAGGGRLSNGYRQRLMDEQKNQCRACACDLLESGHHLDHIVPVSKGGLHCDDNVQLLCPLCNRRKAAKNFEDFIKSMKEAA
jgi:hypothetical protein